MKIHGIKQSKACQIAACFEIARRLESFSEDAKPRISSPEDVYRRLYPGMRESKKETFVELCLDTKNQPQGLLHSLQAQVPRYLILYEVMHIGKTLLVYNCKRNFMPFEIKKILDEIIMAIDCEIC